MNKAEINMDEYLELLEIKKNFDKKAKEISNANLENLKSVHNRLEMKYYHVETESRMIKLKNDSLKCDVNELKTKNTKQMFQIQILKHELETIKNKWYYKLFDSKRTLH